MSPKRKVWLSITLCAGIGSTLTSVAGVVICKIWELDIRPCSTAAVVAIAATLVAIVVLTVTSDD